MKHLIRSIERRTTGFALLVSCAMLAVAAGLGFRQILTRFVLEQPSEWTEVLIRFALIWMVFMGIAAAFRQGAMVCVDVLHRWSGPGMRRFLEWSVAAVRLVLLVLILWIGWDSAQRGKVQSVAGHEEMSMFRACLAMLWPAIKQAAWALLMPVIILGGIYGGIFTPTEASAVAVVYALFVGMVVYREIKPRDLLPILKKSAISSSVILFIIANAGLFAFMITRAGVPDAIGQYLTSVLQSPFWFLLGVNAALFAIGMLIETSASIIVLAPILAPVAMHFGIDPVHFGILMVVNLALGMITPPFGVNLFAACTVARISLDRIIPKLVPFVLVVLGCLAVVTYVPVISLGLRDLVYR